MRDVRIEPIDDRRGSGYHDFWLFREGERKYGDYWDRLGRRDAPVRLSDSVMCFLHDTLQWVSALNPQKNSDATPQLGFNHFSPTVVAQAGGEGLRDICLGWIQILAHGPDPLILGSGGIRILPGDPPTPERSYFGTSREKLLVNLRLLADLADQVAVGNHFILHIGV